MSKRAVFLDRDGVLNEAVVRDGKPYPPASMAEFKLIPGVIEAVNSLHRQQWLTIVVTNQPDVARGIALKSEVQEMNDYLCSLLPLDEVKTCFHDSDDNCQCRKPKPGFLLDCAIKYGLNLGECFMVGDRWRDIESGQRAGCKTIFIDYGYAEKQPENADYTVSSLMEAARIILGENDEKSK